MVPSEPRVWLDKVRTILRPLAPLAPGRPHRLLAGSNGLCAVWNTFGTSRGIHSHLIVTTGDAGSQAQPAGDRLHEGPIPCKGQRRGRLAAALGDARTSEKTLREAFDLYREIATGRVEHLGAADDGVSWDLVAICGRPARMTRQRFFLCPRVGLSVGNGMFGSVTTDCLIWYRSEVRNPPMPVATGGVDFVSDVANAPRHARRDHFSGRHRPQTEAYSPSIGCTPSRQRPTNMLLSETSFSHG